MNKKYSILPGAQEVRRQYWNNIFAAIDGIVFNTQGGFDLASKIYPNVKKHSNVAIMPVAIEGAIHPKEKSEAGKELRIAILGHFAHHKGADVIREAIEQLANKDVSFYFFGSHWLRVCFF